MNIFIGKFSTKYPEQIEQRFYAGGEEGSLWYGDVKKDDYVIPIYGGKIFELWQADEFVKKPNKINPEGVLSFKKIQDIKEKIAVSTEFLRNKKFVLDLNTLNKSVKSIKCGFVKINLENPELDIFQLIKNEKRNLYIAEEQTIEPLTYKEMDIRVLVHPSDNDKVDLPDNYKIRSIQIYKNNKFEIYSPLWDLYLERNKENERYNLWELLAYAKKDNASKKLSYLSAVIEDLKDKGWFRAVSPVALYDNVLVGRKRTANRAPNQAQNPDDLSFNSVEDDSLDVYESYRKLLDENPNLILYGPPGTGKTYTAQRIIEYIEKERKGRFLSFEKIIEEDRVKFITFHQSYSYEEFVEGIRPIFEEDTDDVEGSKLQYKITDGIMKEIANRANLNQLKKSGNDFDLSEITKNSRIYKISLGQRNQEEKVYKDCRTHNHISIGWLKDEDLTGCDYPSIYNKLKEESEGDEKPKNNTNTINLFVNEMNIGDIVLVYDGPATIRDIVLVRGDYEYVKNTQGDYPHRRSVKWLRHFDEPRDIIDLNGGVRLTMKTIYPLNRIQFADIKEMLSNDELEVVETTDMDPCYLIIDEINRGNISKIFGELITLIEKDKRDKLKITLPYSRKPFKLPSNIFIIGTMNTADRSIAILDTALRRRFTFVEIEPDPEVIKISDSGIIEDEIDLSRLLEKINDRIQKKYDRDHRIGHSYFMELDNFSKFYNCWYYKIIPLLMDYFYNDLKSIADIIGESFVDIAHGKINRLGKKDFLGSIKKLYES